MTDTPAIITAEQIDQRDLFPGRDGAPAFEVERGATVQPNGLVRITVREVYEYDVERARTEWDYDGYGPEHDLFYPVGSMVQVVHQSR